MTPRADLARPDRRLVPLPGAGSAPAVRAGAALSIALVAGCDGREPDPTAVTIAYCCGIEAVSPLEDETMKFLVFLPMLSYDVRGTPHPRLARSWEHSADHRVWTYHLRTDVRWHDGEPVTARDVAFTLRLLSHPEVAYIDPHAIEAVVVHDDSTVTIRSAGWTSQGHDGWLVFYPEHLLGDLDPRDLPRWPFWQRPVGNGPYRFVRQQPGARTEFEANADFHAGAPRIRRVVLRVLEDAAPQELLAGRIDAVAVPNPMRIPAFSRDPRYRLHLGVVDHVARAVYWNLSHPLFRDRRVRRALTLAMDRPATLRALHLPDSLPIVDGPHTGRQYRRGRLLPAWPHDPGRARALLDEAGWRDSDGDGIRERDGRPLRFTAIVHPDPGLVQVAVVVREQLREIGARMEIQPLERAMMERVRAGDFEAAFVLSQHHVWWLERFFGEESPLGYDDPTVARLIDRAGAAAHPDSVDAAYEEIQRIFKEDLPATFLGSRTEAYLVHRRIRGLDGWWPDPVENMDRLWVE